MISGAWISLKRKISRRPNLARVDELSSSINHRKTAWGIQAIMDAVHDSIQVVQLTGSGKCDMACALCFLGTKSGISFNWINWHSKSLQRALQQGMWNHPIYFFKPLEVLYTSPFLHHWAYRGRSVAHTAPIGDGCHCFGGYRNPWKIMGVEVYNKTCCALHRDCLLTS
jgi:hypothetical protein